MAEKRWARGEFCWYEVGTTDLAAATRFYTGLFGWDLRQVPMGESPPYVLFRTRGEDIAGGYALDGSMGAGVPPHWLAYVAVDDVRADAARAKELGATAVMDVTEVPGVGHVAVLRDPHGASFALFQAGAHPGSGRFPGDPNTFCWSELLSPDPAASVRFYTALFRWESKPSTAADHYTEWTVQGCPVGGLMQLGPEMGGAPPHWMTYVAVEDCDATVKRAASLGGQAIVPAMDIPGVGRFAVLADPQGACFAVIRLNMS
jgi:hypothetical protein